MHTYRGSEAIFNHNSDMSGDVLITARDGVTIQVPGVDILDFVADLVRMNKISALENASTEDLLSGKL